MASARFASGLSGVCLAVALPLASSPARADDAATRPAIKTNRWQEDWSVLANPTLRTAPLDSLKYIPLSSDNPQTYLDRKSVV